jgi:arginine decarboxylase
LFVASKIFLTKGVGRHREKLTSFELALRDARIASFNLVRVSSIFPPKCKLITAREGLPLLTPGQVVYCVMSENATNEPHRLTASSVGLAIPKDDSKYGYLSEHHSFGETDQRAGDYSEDVAAEMLATVLGVEFDPNQELRRAQGHLVDLHRDREDLQHHPVGHRRQERIVDDRRGGCDPDPLGGLPPPAFRDSLSAGRLSAGLRFLEGDRPRLPGGVQALPGLLETEPLSGLGVLQRADPLSPAGRLVPLRLTHHSPVCIG